MWHFCRKSIYIRGGAVASSSLLCEEAVKRDGESCHKRRRFRSKLLKKTGALSNMHTSNYLQGK
jgi:hypothetical protein